jgi:hypothetical protein
MMNPIEAICLEQTRASQPDYLRHHINWPFVLFWAVALTGCVAFWYGTVRALLRVL